MKIYNKLWLPYSVWLIMFILLTTVPFKNCQAIENLIQWWSTEFEFNVPGARSRGIGGAFVGRADDATAAVTNPAGLAQLPGVQIFLQGSFNTWDTRKKAWTNDPSTTTITAPVGGKTINTSQEGEINFDDITDLSFASMSFPVRYEPFNLDFNASFFYNKLANKDTEITLPITFQFAPTQGGTFILYGVNSDIDLEIDEYGFSMAKSFFKDRLMVGGSISVMLLDLESTFDTNLIGSDGFDHDPTNSVASSNQKASNKERDNDVAFRFGALYRVTDKLTIGGSAQIMPEFDYETLYIDLLAENRMSFSTFSDKSSLTVPDIFSLGLSYQITDNWGVFVEGKYIEYSDLMKGFTSFWGRDLTSFNREQFDIDDIWEIHFGTEYIIHVKETPVALRLGGWYEPAHSLEYNANLSSTDFLPNVGSSYEDLMDGGDDVFHYTAGIGVVIKNRLQIDAAADIQDDGNKMTFILSGAYEFY